MRWDFMDFHVAICDDSCADQKYLFRITDNWARSSGNTVVIRTFGSAEEFLFHYEDDKSYDILLLDIELGGMNGVELAKTIRSGNASAQIVFITGYPDFIAEGYEVSALHYLMKPVAEDKLCAVLTRAAQSIQKAEPAVLFYADGESLLVRTRDIVFAEAFAHSTSITTLYEQFDIREAFSDVEARLGDGFIRCHRSYLVGLRHIRRISKTGITLEGGITVPVSRRSMSAVSQAFTRYARGE